MGKLIRRTVTITITETWTIVWTTEDDLPKQATTVVQDNPDPKEEQDELLQATVSDAELGKSSMSETQPDGVSTRPAASGRSRRTRRRREGQ
jgi:hypothetical protein